MLKTSGVIGLVLLARWSWPCFHSSRRLLRPSPARKKGWDGCAVRCIGSRSSSALFEYFTHESLSSLFSAAPHKQILNFVAVCVFGKNMEITLLFGLPTIGLFFHCARQFYFHVKNWPDCIFTLFFPLPTIPMGRRLSFLSLHYFSPWKP